MEIDVNPLSLLEVSLVENDEDEVMDFPISENPVVTLDEEDPLAFGEEEGSTPPVNNTMNSAQQSNSAPMLNSTVLMNNNVWLNGTMMVYVPTQKELMSPEQKINLHLRMLSEISPEELAYRRSLYQILDAVLTKRLHCTVCDTHIGCSLVLNRAKLIHPVLKTLVCTRCYQRYSDVIFPLCLKGKDMRCRWCGQMDTSFLLKSCTQCPFSFCVSCISLNFSYSVSVEKWTCFVCNITKLWPHRALVWALISILNNMCSKKVRAPEWCSDMSQCCQRPTKITGSFDHLSRKNCLEQPSNKRLKKFVPILWEVQKTPSTSYGPNPNNNSLATNIDARWFNSAVNNMLDNVEILGNQLRMVKGTVKELDTILNVSKAIDTLSNLLLLTSQQMYKNGLSVKQTWKKRLSLAKAKQFHWSLSNPRNPGNSMPNLEPIQSALWFQPPTPPLTNEIFTPVQPFLVCNPQNPPDPVFVAPVSLPSSSSVVLPSPNPPNPVFVAPVSLPSSPSVVLPLPNPPPSSIIPSLAKPPTPVIVHTPLKPTMSSTSLSGKENLSVNSNKKITTTNSSVVKKKKKSLLHSLPADLVQKYKIKKCSVVLTRC